MNYGLEVVERIKAYDLILLDTNFITQSSHDIVWELYDLRSVLGLGSVEEDIVELNEDLQWKLEDVVEDERVFTIPEVVDEISKFKKIFYKSYNWHKRRIEFTQRKRPFKKNKHSERRLHRKRITESLIEKTLKDIRENDINPYNTRFTSRLLYPLNDVVRTLEEVISNLKIYQGLIGELNVEVRNASETDHLLVGAAFGCFLENQERKIAIISDDQHIEEISYKNSVYPCFDIITLLSTISQKIDKVGNIQQYAINV